MRKFVITMLVAVMLAPSLAYAQVAAQATAPQTLATVAADHAAKKQADRQVILDVLSRGEVCVSELASTLGLTESAVSHQLRLLRNTRIVRGRRNGRMVIYALDDEHVLDLFRQGLRHVQEGGR